MTDYRFETTWRLPAAQQDAWALLADGEGWPRWWPSVHSVERLTPGSPNGLGRLLRYHFTTRLPYTLTFDARLVEVTEPTRLVAVVEGELAGTWTCDLVQEGDLVVVRHVWAVSTTRSWMNALAPLARPVFSWNHAALMREGGHGFAQHLGTSGWVEDDPARHRRDPTLAAVSLLVVAGLVLRRVRRR